MAWNLTTVLTLIGIVLSTIALLIIPGIALLIRSAIRVNTLENRLANVIEDLTDLIRRDENIHNEIIATSRSDRDATDKRLRYIEEHIWSSVGSARRRVT